jgi:hypothetical protein
MVPARVARWRVAALDPCSTHRHNRQISWSDSAPVPGFERPQLQVTTMAPMRRAPIRGRLSDWPRRALDWLCEGRSDYRAFRERRRSRAYRHNRTLCLYAWALAAGLLLVCGDVGCLLTLALIATLVCFAMLDPD